MRKSGGRKVVKSTEYNGYSGVGGKRDWPQEVLRDKRTVDLNQFELGLNLSV